MTSDTWRNKTVVISGGSSGLGFHLAKAAAKQGAKIAILGRSQEKLDAAKVEIEKFSQGDLSTFAVDALSPQQSSDFLEWLESRHVDLLINAIGRSDRGELEQLSPTDLESLIRDNVLTAFNVTQLSLKSLKKASGCIVNIGSLAGLIASPRLGGYCVSKFALSAYSTQLRLELEGSGVHVLLVSPGPIRREDSHNRYAELAQSRGIEKSGANAPGGGANIKLIDPERLSELILRSASRRDRQLIIPSKVKWLAAIRVIWPWLGDQILKRNLKR